MLAAEFANLFDQPCGRKTLHEGQDANLAADCGEHGTLARIQCFGPVIAPFDVNIRLNGSQKAVRAFFGENDYGIDARQSSDHLGALLLRDERSAGAFELADRLVAIEANDEEFSEFLRALEIADVAEMKQIETPVGGHNFFPVSSRCSGPTSDLWQG